ncbi:MAG: hypothetical protein IPI35_19280 [Deltaproteobacteria bacterium]|nr:hypothetical protein [Deltaproteobacteria bacterium]
MRRTATRDADTDSDSDADPLYTHWTASRPSSTTSRSPPGNRECDMIWNVTGTPSTTDCPDCLFAFDVSLTYDAANSTASDACSGLAGDLAYSYGYVEDYYGYGPSRVGRYYGTYGWSSFANAEFDASNDTLKYSSGSYVDYAYSGYYTGYVTYYYTNYYTGDVQLTK